MKTNKTQAIALTCILATLAGCDSSPSPVDCSDQSAIDAVTAAIKEGIEASAGNRVQGADGTRLVLTSKIRSAIGQLKFSIEAVRTTKEDPESTKRYCTGKLKVVYGINMLKDAEYVRKQANLDSVNSLADKSKIERFSDYFKVDLDYDVQPTDDGKQTIATIENSSDKIDVFAEIVASHLLKPALDEAQRKGLQLKTNPQDIQSEATQDVPAATATDAAPSADTNNPYGEDYDNE